MVRQLLTVTRLESGALKPRSEVVSLGPRVRKAWEALGVPDVPFSLDDDAAGWLAVADADQLDQVLWALLDNAVKYGAASPIAATVVADALASQVRLTIEDRGPGVAEGDRERLFARFSRGGEASPDGGSGLGLYVSRELCRAMDGDLVLEPAAARTRRGVHGRRCPASRATRADRRVVAGGRTGTFVLGTRARFRARSGCDYLGSTVRRQPDNRRGPIRCLQIRERPCALERSHLLPPRRRTRRVNTRAQAVVEFAIILPVFLLFLLMAIDFGRLFFTYVQVSNAAREAANYGAVQPTDTAGMQARAVQEKNTQTQGEGALEPIAAACRTPAGASITCAAAAGGTGAGNILTVTVTQRFSFLTPLITQFFGGALPVSADASTAVLGSAVGSGTGGPGSCGAPTNATFTVFASGLDIIVDPAGSMPDTGVCTISGYNWDFGDGETDVGSSIPTSHTYASAGHLRRDPRGHQPGRRVTAVRTVTVPFVPPTASPSPSPTPTITPARPRPPRPPRRRPRPRRRVRPPSRTSPGRPGAHAAT